MMAKVDPDLTQTRPMTLADLDEVMEIERQAYPFPWTHGIFKDCLMAGYAAWVLQYENKIIGYGVLSAAADEAHLLNLCVQPTLQGSGLGRHLLEKMVQLARWYNAETIYLEVRASNSTAIHIYETSGFNEIGIRPDYYPSKQEREDAIVMARPLKFPEC